MVFSVVIKRNLKIECQFRKISIKLITYTLSCSYVEENIAQFKNYTHTNFK